MIPTRPKEEIGTYSVLSKADYIDDLKSPVDKTDKVAKLSPRAEIKGHEEQCDKEENGSDHEGRNEEENSEEMKKDDTEKRDVFDDNLENAYDLGIVQRATKGIYCKKRDKTVKSKKRLRRHLEKGHQTVKNQHVIVVITCSMEEQIQEFMYTSFMNMIMKMKKEKW